MDIKFRAKGYYWVNYGEKWQVMEWCGQYWYRCGGEWGLSDTHLREIGERVERPSAVKATLDIQNVGCHNSEKPAKNMGSGIKGLNSL